MIFQTISQLVLALGIIASAVGGYWSYQLVLALGITASAVGGLVSYLFGKIEERNKDKATKIEQRELKDEISFLKAMTAKIAEQNDLIYQSTTESDEEWHDLEMKHVPPGVTDYLLLIFVSDLGRILGKVRIKGSTEETSFSTTANNRTPVALRNLWIPLENKYKTPTIMQYMISEKTHPQSSLKIYTKGFIFSRGMEPH